MGTITRVSCAVFPSESTAWVNSRGENVGNFGLEILPLKAPADQRYAEIRAHLESTGKTIGPNDMLIAAHCLAEDLVVVTANVDEFGRVPGLKVENWLAD